MKQSNILDPIHDGLSALVWDQPDSTHPKLKRQHKTWIKRTIFAALAAEGYTDVEKWLHLVLTGSICTYQYSNDSDIDVSLFVDAVKLPEWSRAEMIGVMVGKVDGTTLPGTPFVMQDFVVPSEVQPKDLYKPGLRSGYDLDLDAWIVPPERERVHDVEAEQNGFYVYALECADKMERLLRYEPDKAVQYWHQIHKRRQRDQRAGKGDYSEANIVYKFLANRGLFDSISQASGEYIAKTAAWSPEGYNFEPHRHFQECHDIAFGVEKAFPELKQESGFYVHPTRGAGDHSWNVAPDGTIVDTTAEQHRDWPTDRDPRYMDEESPIWTGPEIPEIIPPNHPHYQRYIGYNTHWPGVNQLAANEYKMSLPDYLKMQGIDVDPREVEEHRVSAWHDHFVNSIEPIAQAYERLPMYDPMAAKAWKSLGDDSMRRAQEIQKRLHVQVTDDPEPYPTPQHMFNDINQGKFVVSRANSEHPIWTPEQNVAFRTVHDVLGHHPSGGDFSWQGENQACGAHFPLLAPDAQRALMTECLGQTGYAIHNGGFGPQKVGLMDDFIGPAQQAYNGGTFSSVPEGGFCHRHLRHGIYTLTKPASWDIIGDDGIQNLTSQTHQSELAQAPEGHEQAQIAFPSVEDAVAANQATLAAAGQTNHALLRPEVLDGALSRAINQHLYTGSIANAAAALAHGVGQAQAFEDGNKRTAYWLTHQFLHENGLGHLAPDDDEELADHLIGYGEGTHQMEDTANMLRNRSGGTIAKTAAPRQLAKFVYSPVENRLILGEMGAHEGEKPNHRQLAVGNFDDAGCRNLIMGHVGENGYVETYGRPQITLGGGEMNPWQAQYMTEEALRRAVPHARFAKPQQQLNPDWSLPADPDVTYMGEPPQVLDS